MKYAILGPRKGVLCISDTQPQHTPPRGSVAEISDEQAAQIESARPRILFLLDGVLADSPHSED